MINTFVYSSLLMLVYKKYSLCINKYNLWF